LGEDGVEKAKTVVFTIGICKTRSVLRTENLVIMFQESKYE